jgi:uncharacterized membrane protein
MTVDTSSKSGPKASGGRGPLLGGHWRPPLAALAGALAGWAASHAGMRTGAAALVGWDVAALLYLVTTGWMLLTDDADDLRARAAREDEPPMVLSVLVMAALLFGFGAVMVAMREGSAGGGSGGVFLSVLAIATLVLSWLCMQALFTLHYAHRYAGDSDGDGIVRGGIQMTGDPPRTYRDFIYISVCIGACFQVSDFGPKNTGFRNLITVHALISFAFNALVIALGVGIIGDLLKG